MLIYDLYLGYCVDVMDKLAEMIGFNYTVYYVKDDMFGSKDPVTKQWNGMLKDLVERVSENICNKFNPIKHSIHAYGLTRGNIY